MIEYIHLKDSEVLMRIFAPKYYLDFKCIADKCKHSCCVGWEIDIDETTLNKYLLNTHPYCENINKSIDFSESPHFKLDQHGNCPHLNEQGLCNIILNCGDDYICDICREHPRFYNFTNYGKEVGIGMSCEAACELILNSDNFDQIIEISSDEFENIVYEFDSIQYRDIVFQILKDESLYIEDKINKICSYFNIAETNFSIFEVSANLEFLNEKNKSLFLKSNNIFWNNSLSNQLSRIFAYYIYRHSSEADDLNEFIVSISFAIFCTGLVSTLADKNNIYEIARIVSEEIEYSQDNTEFIKSLFTQLN